MRTAGVLVFNRVVMDVVQMVSQIRGIADGVFPKAALPDAACTLSQARL